jgi:hypothetical protein
VWSFRMDMFLGPDACGLPSERLSDTSGRMPYKYKIWVFSSKLPHNL